MGDEILPGFLPDRPAVFPAARIRVLRQEKKIQSGKKQLAGCN